MKRYIIWSQIKDASEFSFSLNTCTLTKPRRIDLVFPKITEFDKLVVSQKVETCFSSNFTESNTTQCCTNIEYGIKLFFYILRKIALSKSRKNEKVIDIAKK